MKRFLRLDRLFLETWKDWCNVYIKKKKNKKGNQFLKIVIIILSCAERQTEVKK